VFDDLHDDEKGTIYGLAMGTPELSPRRLRKALEAAVRARGGRPDSEAKELMDGVWVEMAVHTFEVHGAWVTIESDRELPLSFARELAAQAAVSLTAHVLEVRDEVVQRKRKPDEWGFRNRYRTLEVQANGTMSDREPVLTESFAAVAHGDFAETAHALLWAMVTEQDTYSPVERPAYLGYLFPPPRSSSLPPRMAELATLIEESGRWGVQQVAGQTMVKLELPDGSRRLSRVNADELAQLRAATGIEPS
jgi:hypothetical protein